MRAFLSESTSLEIGLQLTETRTGSEGEPFAICPYEQSSKGSLFRERGMPPRDPPIPPETTTGRRRQAARGILFGRDLAILARYLPLSDYTTS